MCLSESVRRARGRLGIQVRHDHLTSVRPQTFRDGESDPTGRTGHDRDTRIQLCTVSLCQASSLAIDARTELENAQTVRPDPEADPTWSAGLTAFKLVTVRADDGSRTMMRPRRLDAVTDRAAAPVIAKYTDVLAATDVFTHSTTFWVLQSIRIDLG